MSMKGRAGGGGECLDESRGIGLSGIGFVILLNLLINFNT